MMRKLLLLISVIGFMNVHAHAQTVNSGSTGADGEFNAVLLSAARKLPPGTITDCSGAPLFPDECTFTILLREPPNHIFNFTTVNVENHVTVRFTPNRANTPVFILTQGDVTISGLIDLTGAHGGTALTPAAGGPGGFSGGTHPIAGAPTSIGGAGIGPGGGPPGPLGAPNPSSDYFTPDLQPLIGGSGRGAESTINGNGGGGAVLIASSGVIDLSSPLPVQPGDRAIDVSGGIGITGGGGVIRLVANILKGNRGLYAIFDGRIRLDIAQTNLFQGKTDPPATFNPPGQPIVIFPPITPTVRIVSIGGITLPSQPAANLLAPDITLANSASPVSVVLEATNVPSGTPVKVIVSPQYGAGPRIILPLAGSPPIALTGSVWQPKHATVSVTLPDTGVGIISALIDSVVPEP
jgi:hypothetical protein